MNIFLSYPHKDKSLAIGLKNVLFNSGHTVWMDDLLNTGQNWREQLELQLKQADAIALAITPNWLTSPYCQWEFITAVENGKKVIPVMLERIDDLPERLSQYQFADFTDGFSNTGRVQKFLDDLLKLAVTVGKNSIAKMDKELYAEKINQENSQQSRSKNMNVDTVGQSHQMINVSGNIQSGNINLGGGSQIFYGNVNITLGNLAQSVNSSSNYTYDEKIELEKLIIQLESALQNVSAENQTAAQKVADRTKELITEVSAEQIEPEAIEMKANLLKKAAENIKEILPAVLSIATQIIVHALRMSGIGS